MNRLLLFCLILAGCVPTLRGAWTDPDPSFGSLSSTPVWYLNGSTSPVQYANGVLSSSGSAPNNPGGSLIYKGQSLGDTYALRATYRITQADPVGAPNYNYHVLYVRASVDAKIGPQDAGSFYALTMTNIVFANGVCANATLTLYRRFQNGYYQVSQVPTACSDQMQIVMVTKPGYLLVNYPSGYFESYSSDGPTSGQPGVGATFASGPNGLSKVELFTADSTAPNAISSAQIMAWPNRVEMQWSATTDDTNGAGLWRYQILRRDPATNLYSFLTNGPLDTTSFVDEGVSSPASGTQSYDYFVRAIDLFQNIGPTSVLSVTMPSPSAVDPRRIGVRPTGAYWGALGEQIDLLSGNVNYTVPLVQGVGRNGLQVPISLSYNSQIWQYASANTFLHGQHIGVGLGWRLQVGSVRPVYSAAGTLHHYVLADSTGAEYRLDQNSSGLWSSTDGTYAQYNSSTQQLFWPDGTFWKMDVVATSTEPDAGTQYPSVIQDRNGNQILFRYDWGAGGTSANGSSGRLAAIEDVRAQPDGGGATTRSTYRFSYDVTQPVHRLTSVTNNINSGEGYSFTYQTAGPLFPPSGFGGGTGGAYTSTYLLTSIVRTGLNTSQTFTYPLGSPYYTQTGVLQGTTLPTGGTLSWSYQSIGHNGGAILQQEVISRSLSKNVGGANPVVYSLSYTDGGSGSSPYLHASRTLDDPSPDATLTNANHLSRKVWYFVNDPIAPWKLGLLSSYDQWDMTGSVAKLNADTYSWSQDGGLGGGNPYLSSTSHTENPALGGVTKRIDQAVDAHGNVTDRWEFDWGHQAETRAQAARWYQNTYLTSNTNYTSRGIWNLLSTAVVKKGDNTGAITTVNNTFDQYSTSCGSTNTLVTVSPTLSEFSDPGTNYRGNVTSSAQFNRTSRCIAYDQTGAPVESSDGTGASTKITMASSSNNAAPSTVMPLSASSPTSTDTALATSATYTGFLAPLTVTQPNGATTTTHYESSTGRVDYTTDVWGAKTSYLYYYNPLVITATVTQTNGAAEGRKTITTLDGLGRVSKVEVFAGGASVSSSVVDTVYDSCGCSPAGKTKQVSRPYNPNALPAETPVWTKYTFDAVGRPLSTLSPDGASTTQYEYGIGNVGGYSTNTVKVTDPAGKWKKVTTDAWGNTIRVEEPNPDNTANNYVTQYTYDLLNHLTRVALTRSTGNVTVMQPDRTFTYDAKQHLGSSTTPESGTINYTYNADDTLDTRTDAKGQVVKYTYDPYKRVTKVDRKVPLPPNNTLTIDPCQSVSFAYDNNLIGSMSTVFVSGLSASDFGNFTSSGNWGKRTAAQWGSLDLSKCGGLGIVTEQYTYLPQGNQAISKRLRVDRPQSTGGTVLTGRLDWTASYDGEGRRTSENWPYNGPPYSGAFATFKGAVGYGYDTLGRPTIVSVPSALVTNASYNAANQLKTLTWGGWTETRDYNSMGQLTAITVKDTNNTVLLGQSYMFSATQNNGQITGSSNTTTGEAVTYGYDSVARLNSAATGSSGPQWGLTFGYDEFGNRTSQSQTKGAPPAFSINVDSQTNRVQGTTYVPVAYDNNGNMTQNGTATYDYDVENRLRSSSGPNGSQSYIAYDPQNRRIWNASTGEFQFYTPDGRRVATYALQIGTYTAPGGGQQSYWAFGNSTSAIMPAASVYFGKRLIATGSGLADGTGSTSGMVGTVVIAVDRLGSVRLRSNQSGVMSYYPYGEEQGTGTANNYDKFATYFRDASSGLDYADQRYYLSQYGRFLTQDPDPNSAKTDNPVSWNRYAYGLGDPVNFIDSTGAQPENCGPGWADDASLSGPCGGGASSGGVGAGEPGEPDVPWSMWGPDMWIQDPTTGLFLINGNGQAAIPLSLYNQFLPQLQAAGFLQGPAVAIAEGIIVEAQPAWGRMVVIGTAGAEFIRELWIKMSSDKSQAGEKRDYKKALEEAMKSCNRKKPMTPDEREKIRDKIHHGGKGGNKTLPYDEVYDIMVEVLCGK